MTSYCIYHKRDSDNFCMDGIVSLWILDRYLQEHDMEYIPAWYEDISEELMQHVKPNSKVYVVDYSLTAKEIEVLSNLKCHIKIYDHHLGLWDRMFNLTEWVESVNYDINECGSTVLLRQLYGSNKIVDFLQYVKAYDIRTAEWYEDITKNVYAGMFSEQYKTVEEYFALFDKLENKLNWELIRDYEQIGKEKRADTVKQIEQLSKQAFKAKTYQKHLIVVCKFDSSQSYIRSDLAEHLLYKNSLYKDCHYALVYQHETDANKPYVVSLRSLNKYVGDNFDVRNIAKLHGGNGHRNAAGCQISNLFQIIKPFSECNR